MAILEAQEISPKGKRLWVKEGKRLQGYRLLSSQRLGKDKLKQASKKKR